MQYWIVDVCNTLVAENTTNGLLRWHFARMHKLRVLFPFLLTARYSPLRVAAVAFERFSNKSVIQGFLLKLLDGETSASVEISAQEYARWLLSKRVVEPVFRYIREAVDENRLILASASLEPVVRALARELRAQYVASTLEIEGGVLTGKFLENITSRKPEFLDRRFGTAWRDHGYFAMSDNLTDRELLVHADKAYVVIHDQRAHDSWRRVSGEFVEIKI